MSRLLLLVLVLIWMAGSPDKQPLRDMWLNLGVFFSFYVLLVLLLGLWSRLLARRVAAGDFHRQVKIFNKVMFGARLMIPIWFMVGVWYLGWSGALIKLLGDGIYKSAAGMLLGTLPAFATWMGLWWSQYPAERALREQNLLVELDNDLPLYRPPAFRSYFFSNFRLQVLFTLVPVAMIVVVRDVVMWGIFSVMGQPFSTDYAPQVEAGASIFAAAAVFLFAPALLSRVLNTSPMPDGPLRQRLDGLCKRSGIRYRHILVWNTNNHVGNAAVMGVLPWLRYVLLSDVLLERMSDRQIEAVFAHELGHVVYRHMTWYAIFFVAITLIDALVYQVLAHYFVCLRSPEFAGLTFVGGLVSAMFIFGLLSRRCERQADVYAARTMEMLQKDLPLTSEALLAPRQLVTVGAGSLVEPRSARQTTVGEQGATIFASALRRVATINNIPVNPTTRTGTGFWNHLAHHADSMLDLANNWMHGSIASRIEYVEHLSVDPRRTGHFDRTMFWIYWGLTFALFFSVVFSVMFGSMGG